MNEEIKEILDIEKYRNKDGYVENMNLLPDEIHKLLDYITNLQKKYENAVSDYEFEHYKNKKAKEYIMTELITEWDIKNDGYVSGSDLPVDAITPILNILNGSDDK